MPNSHARSSLLPNTLLICLTFLLLSSSATAALSDYSESSDSAPESPCIKDSTYDCAKCGCDFDPTGGGFNVAFSCLTVMALLVTIAGYISVKEMREAPGDIVFGLCVSDFVLSLEWIVQGGLRLKYNQTLSPSSDGCVALSYLDVIFNLLSNFYNIIFLAFFFMATRTSLKITRIPQYLYHVIPILGTVIGVIVTYAQDLFGMSMYGICSFEESNDYFLPVLIIVIFTVFPFITAYAVKKSLPECKRLSSVRFQFLQYYLIYVFTASFFDVASSISSLFLIDEVNKMIQNPYYIGNPTLAIIFGNVFRVFRPLTLAIIRLYDPNIRKHWPKIIPCLRRRGKSTMKISMLGEVQKEDFDGRHRIVSLSFLEMQENLKNTPFLNQIQHTVRVQVLYSLLSSIHFYWRMSKKTQLLSYKTATDGFQIDYKKMAKITEQIKISDGMIKKEMPEMMREISIKDYKGIEGVLTVHAPGIFREIIETDGKSDYLSISLDLTANYNRIIKAGINNGGKSGEFFFFSYDNSLVIKTISNEELKTLLEILPMYSQHFKSNPKSLIAKIYGVFTFKRIEPYEMYNLILMKNVNGLPSECVERKYDLKGSTYGRVTIKSGNPQLSELKYFDTLKDIDFLKFEKKLNIEPCLRETLLRTLKADSEFLRKNNLIDYSLVVYVLKKVVKPINRSDSEISIVASSTDQADPRTYAGRSYFLYDSSVSDESQSPRPQQRARSLVGGVEPSFSRESVLHEMRSTTEDNVFYHVGVIDYLIKYNMKKRLEKFGKKLLACNPKLDISVQSPQFYAQRFRDYMEKIIS